MKDVSMLTVSLLPFFALFLIFFSISNLKMASFGALWVRRWGCIPTP